MAAAHDTERGEALSQVIEAQSRAQVGKRDHASKEAGGELGTSGFRPAIGSRFGSAPNPDVAWTRPGSMAGRV